MFLNEPGWGCPVDRRSLGHRATTIAALALLTATTVGCTPTGGRGPASAPRALPPISAALYGSPDIVWLIKVAERRLVVQCMSEHGFTYPAVDPIKPAEPQWPRLFGLEELTRTSTGLLTQPAEEPPAGDAYRRALFGDPFDVVVVKGRQMTLQRPANGCQASAEKQLLGTGRQRWMQVRVLMHEIEVQSRKRLESDSGFQSVNTQWRECMLAKGFSYPDPVAVLDTLPAQGDPGAAPAARADIDCKQQTGYLRVAYTRFAMLQSAALAQEPAVLQDWNSLQKRQYTAARAVLAGSPQQPQGHRRLHPVRASRRAPEHVSGIRSTRGEVPVDDHRRNDHLLGDLAADGTVRQTKIWHRLRGTCPATSHRFWFRYLSIDGGCVPRSSRAYRVGRTTRGLARAVHESSINSNH